MKIAYVLSECGNYGPFIVARDIIANIVGETEEIDIFYLKESGEKLTFNAKCKKINLFYEIDFNQYDIVHSHGFIADMFLFLHRKEIKCKRITTLHQCIRPDLSMAYNTMVGFIYETLWCYFVKDFDAVVTLSNTMKEYYSNKIPQQALFYINNGVTPINPLSIVAEDERRILMLKKAYLLVGVSARLIVRKGIDQLIKLLSIDSNVAIVILGDGPEKANLIRLAMQLEVEDRCLFLGYKKNAINYYHYFDVYAMVSKSEGFGLSVIEAASQKVPVVCSDIPTFFELFTNDEVVRYKLDDIESLKNAINYIVQHKTKYSNNIYLKYLNRYSSSIMAANYLALYTKIASK